MAFTFTIKACLWEWRVSGTFRRRSRIFQKSASDAEVWTALRCSNFEVGSWAYERGRCPSTVQKKAIYTNISQFLFTFHQIPFKLGEHHKTLLESSLLNSLILSFVHALIPSLNFLRELVFVNSRIIKETKIRFTTKILKKLGYSFVFAQKNAINCIGGQNKMRELLIR